MSLRDIGMVASSLRVVSFTARFHKGGVSMSASRHPKRKPSAPNINALIIEISAPWFSAYAHHQSRLLGQTEAETWRQFGANR
jgi:hypothetical protein